MGKGTVKIAKPCAQCGKTMKSVSLNRMYCEVCVKRAKLWLEAHPEKKAEFRENAKKQAQRKREEAKQKPTTVEEIDKLAKAEGLSYGKYVAKYGV